MRFVSIENEFQVQSKVLLSFVIISFIMYCYVYLNMVSFVEFGEKDGGFIVIDCLYIEILFSEIECDWIDEEEVKIVWK